MTKIPSTHRFSNRVENYVKYRPGYPLPVIDFLNTQCNLQAGAPIADIGAGTGIFTKLLLDAGFEVFAVEPNKPMRDAAAEFLGNSSNLFLTDGSAEATGLAEKSVDLIICAQAFHWFNTPATLAEFQRVLRPDGDVALIWNKREVTKDEMAMEYDSLLKRYASDYNAVKHQNLREEDFEAFYHQGNYTLVKFPNSQLFDETGFIGRVFSSSYVPAQETADGQQFLGKIKAFFERYQQNGKLEFRYQTEVYLGKI